MNISGLPGSSAPVTTPPLAVRSVGSAMKNSPHERSLHAATVYNRRRVACPDIRRSLGEPFARRV